MPSSAALRASVRPSRAILERRPIHIESVEAAARNYPDSMPLQRVGGARTLLVVPLLRGSATAGAIVVRRRPPFTTARADLRRTFADLAALAIENAGLVRALRARDRKRSPHGR